MKRSEINIYNRDCLEAMREMPDNAFDLAIVDPHYARKVIVIIFVSWIEKNI